MAIPFRAKDVPAGKNTEYGNPDVAVTLTLLSYYYSGKLSLLLIYPKISVNFAIVLRFFISWLGLNDEQLVKVFGILSNTPNSKAIYDKWIDGIDTQLIYSPLLQEYKINKYTGINLDDPNQRDNVLFPLLRYNMSVIDFWLSNAVFTRELKIFEKKLTCTPWDLCSDNFDWL